MPMNRESAGSIVGTITSFHRQLYISFHAINLPFEVRAPWLALVKTKLAPPIYYRYVLQYLQKPAVEILLHV